MWAGGDIQLWPSTPCMIWLASDIECHLIRPILVHSKRSTSCRSTPFSQRCSSLSIPTRDGTTMVVSQMILLLSWIR